MNATRSRPCQPAPHGETRRFASEHGVRETAVRRVARAKVYEDEHVFAFMDAGRVNDGHVIVATKQPFETLSTWTRTPPPR